MDEMGMDETGRRTRAERLARSASYFIERTIAEELKPHEGHRVDAGPCWGLNNTWEFTCRDCNVAVGLTLAKEA